MKIIDNILKVESLIANKCLVIFDLDDTLYSEKEYLKSGYKKVAELVPMILDAEKQLWRFFEEKKDAIDQLLLLNGIYSDQLKEKCICAYRSQKPDISLYEGVREMLKRIRLEGKRIAIVTDGRPEGQRAKLKALDVECLVDKIIITDELGGIAFRKPNPLAFEILKDEFQTEYSSMVYIGDNLKKDPLACDVLGIDFIYFHNNESIYYNHS